jgi:hypothetical protein
MGQSFGIGEIVDGDEVDILIRERGAENVASDTSESIDANFYSHCASERDFDCLRKYAGTSKQVLMLTGSSSQRKCHAVLLPELQAVN